MIHVDPSPPDIAKSFYPYPQKALTDITHSFIPYPLYLKQILIPTRGTYPIFNIAPQPRQIISELTCQRDYPSSPLIP